MLAIFKKELRSFFLTPTGYIFMSLFLLLSGIFFTNGNLFSMNSNFTAGFIGSAMFIFMLVSPVLTMKLLTDEQRFRTDQLLLTSPIRIIDIVLGKYFAAVAFFALTLLVTVLYAVIIAIYGDLIVSETLGAYIGFILLGSCFISIGLFISGTTENQVVAAIVTFGALLFMWLIDFIMQALPTDPVSGAVFAGLLALGISAWLYFSTKNLIIGVVLLVLSGGTVGILFAVRQELFINFIGRVLDWFSVLKRFNSFATGIIKLSDLIYYLSFAGFFIFLTIRVIEKRRWS